MISFINIYTFRNENLLVKQHLNAMIIIINNNSNKNNKNKKYISLEELILIVVLFNGSCLHATSKLCIVCCLQLFKYSSVSYFYDIHKHIWLYFK